MYTLAALEQAELTAVLEGQYGAIARWQARALGISDDAWDRRVTRGLWEPRHTGVVVAAPWRYHALSSWAAAVLRGGDGAHLSLGAAASLLGVELRGCGRLVELWVPHGSRRPAPARGLIMRRSRLLTGELDVTTRRALPVTTLERTIVDRFGRPMPDRDRESLFAEVLQRRLTSERRLAACAARNLRGARVLRELLGVVAGFDSGLELDLDRLARSVGIMCDVGVTIVHPNGQRDEVDLLDVSTGTVLEADGWRFHRDPGQREHDELKDERLRGLGLVVVRFTTRQIREREEESRSRIRAAAAPDRWWLPPKGVQLVLRRRAAA